jgi:hypothetical protein
MTAVFQNGFRDNLIPVPTTPRRRFDIGMGLSVELMLIGPDLAAEFLSRQHGNQRGLKRKTLQRISQDLVAGRWKLNGEAIIFDSSGSLVDGQHRLKAVVITKTPITSIVVYGVNPSTYTSIDAGSPRSPYDALKSEGIPNAQSVSSAALLLLQYEQGKTMSSHTPTISKMEVQEIVSKNPGLVEWSRITHGRISMICRSRVVPVFCGHIMSLVNDNDAKKFFRMLESGENLASGDPILAFRNLMSGQSMSGHSRTTLIRTAHALIKSWNMWRQGKSCKVLRVTQTEEFPTPL